MSITSKDTTLNGGNGNDTLQGSLGNDMVLGGAGNDTLGGGDGNDMLNGGIGTDLLNGNFGNDTLDGSDGNDKLDGSFGDDLLQGGNGNDRLEDSWDTNTLMGGAGADYMVGNGGFSISTDFNIFKYNSVSESLPGMSNRDTIDFVGRGEQASDRIDFTAIDANAVVSGNQAFAYIGSAAFTAAGQLRYSGGLLQGSIDADSAVEFEIQLVGAPALSVGGAGTDILL